MEMFKIVEVKKMIKRLAIILSLVVSLCGCQTKEEKTQLLVMAAASMQDVLEELKEDYEKTNKNVSLEFTFGASGTLQNQIEQGAPADLFISAANKQMNALDEKGLILENTKQNLLENRIVVITPKNSELKIEKVEDLLNVSKIALGEPQSVPVGQYSEEVFNKLGILNEITPHAIYGSDVRTVLSWVEASEVDCGIVYSTDAMISEDVNVALVIPNDLHQSIIYPVGVLKNSKHQEETKDFVEYLKSEKAMSIFEKYGFNKGF